MRKIIGLKKFTFSFLLFIVFFYFLSSVQAAETILDQSGKEVIIEKPFSRIISLYPAHTENLYSLGLDKEIIGVSKNDDFPIQVKDKPTFHYRQDPEKFIGARPDLVLIRPMIQTAYPDLIQKLSMTGIEVVSLQPTSISETFEYWRILGKLTGRSAQAEEMINKFQEDLSEISEVVISIPMAERKSVYFEAIHSKMKTFSPESMSIFSLTSAGGINAAQDAVPVRKSNIAAYGKERIMSKADEIDIFLAQVGRMNNVTLKMISEEPGFDAIKAVKNKQIFLIEENLVSRPTMRIIEGIRQIGKILYPDKF